MKRFLNLLLIFVLPIFLVSSLSYAEFYEINELSVNINVNKDSTIEVTEDFYVTFSKPRYGLIRWIPLDYIVNGTKISSLKIYDVQILRNNQTEPFSQYSENGNIVFKIGSANRFVDSYQKYTIRYNAYGVIDFFNDKDLIKWNITGNDHQTNIHKVNFKITFPFDITNNIPYFYVGSYGSTQQYLDYFLSGDNISFFYNNMLVPGQGISFFMDFNKGLFKEPTFLEKILFYIKRAKDALILLFGSLFAIFLAWLKFGKDDYIAIPAKYYPPENMDPCKFGFLLDDRSSPNEVISLIFYWASKGFIKIKEENNDTYLIKMKDLVTDNIYETKLFNLLFKGGKAQTSLGALESERKQKEMQMLNNNTCFPSNEATLDTIYNEIKKDAEVKGIYTKSSIIARNTMLTMLFIIPFLAFFVLNISFLHVLILGVIFIILIITSKFMYKKTDYGNKLFSEVKGFEMFLRKVENPQIEVLMKNEVNYCSKVLPYAVAAGVTNEFLNKMQKLMISLPLWYEGNNNFTSFNRSINSSVRSLSTSLKPIPSPRNHSSSIHGASGGFSGGGHGGGGSSSW